MNDKSDLERFVNVAWSAFPFRLTWLVLSRQGACDEVDSAEYRRVRQEWIDAGKPDRIAAFIFHRANMIF